jgi:NTE family protein
MTTSTVSPTTPTVTVEEFPMSTIPTALVLSGAVAKGAFEAGVIDVIAQHGIDIRRIVATSAGALNGSLLAAGIRAGRTEDAARMLIDHWIQRGTWGNAVELSVRDVARGRGLSTSGKLARLLRRSVESFVPGSGQHPISLTLVVAALRGDPVVREIEGTTSYESIANFSGRDLDDADQREWLYQYATAAAAFPGLFAPVGIAELGASLDGGIVNNTPIAHALRDHSEIERVIVVTHTPSLVDAPPPRGLDLVGHVGEMLITERLYRDLREARAVNTRLTALESLVERGALSPTEARAAAHALGYCGKRRIELQVIRPRTALAGGAFAGLSSRTLREQYVDAGRRAAEEALTARVVSVPVADAAL